jgi:hypothetical protein
MYVHIYGHHVPQRRDTLELQPLELSCRAPTNSTVASLRSLLQLGLVRGMGSVGVGRVCLDTARACGSMPACAAEVERG